MSDYDDDFEDKISKLPRFVPTNENELDKASPRPSDIQWAQDLLDDVVNNVHHEIEREALERNADELRNNGVQIDFPMDEVPRPIGKDDAIILDESANAPVTPSDTKAHEERPLTEEQLREKEKLETAELLARMATEIAAGKALSNEEMERLRVLMQKQQNQATHEDPVNPERQRPNQSPAAEAQRSNLAEGATALIGGAASLAGGVATIAGSTMRLGSAAVDRVTQAINESGNKDAKSPRDVPERIEPTFGNDAPVAVLPKLSEYRVQQAEKAASSYESSLKQFWQSGKLPDVRHEIEERARVTGASVEDVMQKMKPGGALEDLHKKFVAAVGESPDAQAAKKAMDKSLDSWIRQHGRAQEELLNPETEQSMEYEPMKKRIVDAKDKMLKNAGDVPTFGDEQKSHHERIQEFMEKMMEKLREILNAIREMLGNKKGSSHDLSHG